MQLAERTNLPLEYYCKMGFICIQFVFY